MIDTLSIKALLFSSVGATQLPGTALPFARVATDKTSQYVRRNAALGSLNPTDLRVSHQPRSIKSSVQRSLFKVEQTRTRIDALSNPLSTVKSGVGFQTDIPEGITLAEWRADCAILIGALTADDGALLTSMYYAET